MFKRANKITALLVAAASVMSIVPAMAADTTRLGTKEGTIENAVAFKDGKYAYEGYKTNSDDKSVYYNAGDKDKELTALTDADLSGSYSDKYAYAVDGNDEYLVDLTDGKVIDDETPTDKADTAATKLKTALKKTDRYGNSIAITSANLDILTGSAFSDVWYGYNATPTDGDTANNDVNNKLYGYTDGAGKYIDASNVANVYAYSTQKGKVVKVENFSNKANDADSDSKLQAELLAAPEFLAQDKENIYQKVSVRITDTAAIGTTTTTNAKAVVNFPTSLTDKAFVGEKAKLTVKWSNVPTSTLATGQTINIGGDTYTAVTAVTPIVAGDKNFIEQDLASLKTAVKTNANLANFDYAEANSVGTFTRKTAGTETTVTNVGDLNAVTSFTDGSAAKFLVAGTTLTVANSDYTDIATLKAAVNTAFAGKVTPSGASNFTYSNGVFTAVNTGYESTANTAFTGSVTFTDGTTQGSTNAPKTIDTSYIQKISKAQGDTKDDAYLPKTVASYELSKNYYDCGDGDDAADHAADATNWTVINGTLAAIRDNGKNVRVTPINLKKDKVKFENGLPTGFTATDKVDVYLAEKGDDGDTDVVSTGTPYSIDVNGDVWAINEGKIKKFVIGSDFKDQFTADRSLDSINVYDEKNLIAWDASGDVYTAVNEGTKVTQDEATVVAPVVVTGWVQGTDGSWTFNDTTGTKVANKWINVGGVWYFMKADGVMATGWYNDNGTWYFLKSSGAMATGWYNDNGTWYFLNASGAMLANTTVDGYVLNGSGAWVK